MTLRETTRIVAGQGFFREIEAIMSVYAGQRQYCVHYSCGTCVCGVSTIAGIRRWVRC
jgi:hypothetical protein